MARGSFVCNASIVGLWLDIEGGLWLEVHLFGHWCIYDGNSCLINHKKA